MTANRDGHDKFQLWVIFGIHIIHIIMTKSKALASCLVLRQTCFRSSHLTLYDPCWKLIAFSQTDLAPCKTRSSGWKYHRRLLDYQSPVKVPFGSFVFSSFFFHWVCIRYQRTSYEFKEHPADISKTSENTLRASENTSEHLKTSWDYLVNVQRTFANTWEHPENVWKHMRTFIEHQRTSKGILRTYENIWEPIIVNQ